MAQSGGISSPSKPQKVLGAKRRKLQPATKSATQQASQQTTSHSSERNFLKKADEALWRFVEKFYPNLSEFILKPLRERYRLTSVICLILVMIYMLNSYSWLRQYIVSCVSHVAFSSSSSKAKDLGAKILIPAPRHFWIKRLEEIKNCTSQLESLEATYKGREIHLYVVGGPGSGKSELARQVGQYLYDAGKANNEPTDVLTFEAETVDSILHSFLEAITLLSKRGRKVDDWISQVRSELNLQRDLFQSYREDTISIEKKIRILFAQLKELLRLHKSRPTLIFDNVQDLRVLYEYLRLEPGREDLVALKILITIQKRDSLPRLSKFVGVIDLYHGMSPNDSVDLLNVITGIKEDPDVDELANVLGKQPLALAAAAVYIESVREGPPKRSSYSYFDYLSEFKHDMEMLGREMQMEWEESLGSNYLDTMHVAVLKATNRTAQMDPILRDIACAVGLADVSSVSLLFVLDYLRNNTHQSYSDAQVRLTLRSCVLFKVGGKEGDEQLTSHQITRQAFRTICKVSCSNVNCRNNTYCHITFALDSKGKADIASGTLKETLSRIVSAFQKQIDYGRGLDTEGKSESDLIYFFTNRSFASQSLDVLSSLCIYATSEKVDVEEVLDSGFFNSFLGFFAHGYGYWPSLVKPVTNEYKLKNLAKLTTVKSKGIRYDLQTLLLVLCVHNGAMKVEKETILASLNKTSKNVVAVVLYKKNDGVTVNETRLLPVLLNILGVMYRGLGYPNCSKNLHQVALTVYEKKKMNHSRKMQLLEKATTLHKLGIINRYLGNLTRGEECHLNSSRILKELFGPNHSSYAASLLNLAVVYSRQAASKSSEAFKLYNRSLAIMEFIFGPKHPYVGRVLNTLGTLYYRLGRFGAAIDCSERALIILEGYYGSYHPHVAEALTFLGFMYRDKGDLKKSKDLLERSLGIKDKIFDPDHFIVGETLNDLGVVYTRLGEPQKAKSVLTRALGIFKQTWGYEHSATATATNSLGAAYLLMGEATLAKALHEEALGIFIKKDGSNVSHSVSETIALLGNTYQALGKVDKAKEMYKNAYINFKNLYGTEHWRVVDLHVKLNSLDSKLSMENTALSFILQVNLITGVALSAVTIQVLQN